MKVMESVGLGEIKVSADPAVTLVSYGLGSCVGLAAFDPVRRVAGMAHVVLPSSSLGRPGGGPGRFADTAVPALLAAMTELGAVVQRLQIKLAGGARMFQLSFGSGGLDIGARNIEAVRAALATHGLPTLAEDLGGTVGRTLQVEVATGRVRVMTVGLRNREL